MVDGHVSIFILRYTTIKAKLDAYVYPSCKIPLQLNLLKIIVGQLDYISVYEWFAFYFFICNLKWKDKKINGRTQQSY